MKNDKIVIEIEENLKPLATAFVNFLEKVRGMMKQGAGGRAVRYEEVEQAFAKESAELERAAHLITLSSLDVDAPRISIRGKTYNRIGRSVGTYFSVVGEVQVERAVYREAGIRNGPTVDPIALRVGAFGNGWLPKTARAMAFLMQGGTAREAEERSEELGRLPYCASSFERVVHDFARRYREQRADIEDHLIEEFDVPRDAASVSVSIDRVSVPMEEARKRPPGRPRKNAPKRLVTRQYRMAWCGTVTLHGMSGEALFTFRYGAMPAGDVDQLCGRMALDVLKLKEKRPELKVTLLADGAHEMWTLLESHFPKSVFGETVSRVDFWHLIEKLAPAAKVIHGEGDTSAAVLRWKLRLLRCDTAADEILDELKDSGKYHVRIDDTQPVHEAITYLQNHRGRMNYAKARKAGLPIGSGNVEATCKSLFAVRMKRAGSRWHEETGEDIVQLRALALSDRWDAAMHKFLATQRTAVRVAA